MSAYFIGNSLTRGLSLERVAWLFEQGGGNLDYGGQAAGGAFLHEHFFMERDSGIEWKSNNFQSAPYGNYENALMQHTFDSLVLQPYQYWLRTDPGKETTNLLGERETIGRFIRYALGDNPTKNLSVRRFYIYNTWPRLLGIHYRNPNSTNVTDDFGNSYTGYTYGDFYNENYTRNPPRFTPRQTVPTRDFITQLVNGVNEDFPDLDEPVRIIPVGEVFAVLDKRIREGTLPGVENYFLRETTAAYMQAARAGDSSFPIPENVAFDASFGIVNFYADQIHMNDQPHDGANDGTIGAYVAALTVYTTLTKRSPVGLPARIGSRGWTHFDADEDAELIRALQEVVLDVVQKDPYTGFNDELSMWGSYPLSPEGDVDTGDWMGWLNVDKEPWLFSYVHNRWLFGRSHWIQPTGGWLYFFAHF